MARVKSVLRRSAARTATVDTGLVRLGTLTVDASRRQAVWQGVELELTALEFDLLYALARHPGQVLSREQLLEQVWGYDYYGDLRVVDAAIKRLRARLRQAVPGEELVATIRGVGYKLLEQRD